MHAPCAHFDHVPRTRHLPVLNQQLRCLARGARLPQSLDQLAGPQGGQRPWKRAGVGCIPPPPSTLPPLLLPRCLIGVPLLQTGKGRHSLHAVGSRESGGRDGCSAHGRGRTIERAEAGVSALISAHGHRQEHARPPFNPMPVDLTLGTHLRLL